MLKVDSHQHFWTFSEEDYGWISEHEKVLKQDYWPEHLQQVLQGNNIDACVAVQARQSLIETKWLVKLSEKHDFIKGVVGWIDIKADNLSEQLKQFSSTSRLKGFRHVLQGEPDPYFMLDTDFVRGLNILADQGYTYDLLVFAHQLPQALQLIKQVPNLNIVVDHIAKPQIKAGLGFDEWQLAMRELGQNKNVYCKVSGMVTEADPNNWSNSDFEPYLQTVFAAFGPDKVMFGSDWPVCLLGGSYSDIKQIVAEYVQSHYAQQYDQVFGSNAVYFYQL